MDVSAAMVLPDQQQQTTAPSDDEDSQAATPVPGTGATVGALKAPAPAGM